jgi:hypothetical protein
MARRPIDRNNTCPFLLRVVWKEGVEHTVDSWKNRSDLQESDEIRLYTWKDVTFRELVEMIKEHLVGARRRDAEMTFSFIRMNLDGKYEIKPVGIVHSTRKSELENTTLADLKFVTGDCLAVKLTYGLG